MSVKVDQIIRTERKTTEIQVSVEGYIIVKAPLNEPIEKIEELIESKKFWLLRTQQITKAKYLNDLHKKYEEGEKFLFLGTERSLKIVNNDPVPLSYKDGTFFLSSINIKFANKFFIDWYKDKAKEYISDIADRFSKIYKIPYKKVTIKDSFSQWASCSGDGNLNFSWRVVLVPHEVIAYLVVHELAHIHLRDHSPQYWLKVEQMMPDYLKYDNCLKEYDHILSIFKNDTGSFDSRRTKDKKDGDSLKGNEQLEFEI
jgi:predicted metal-dependent hydrolase